MRQLVLGVLGAFGFKPDPASGTTNNPILEGIWGAYRRIESALSNDPPTVKGATVIGTTLTADGRTAVTLDVEFDDYDGDALSYTTADGAHGTLTRNQDGTYTYLTSSTTKSDTISITARDTGFHLHSLLSLFKPGGGHTATATLTLTFEQADGVISIPRTGNNWTVRVPKETTDVSLSPDQRDHVTIFRGTDGSFTVSVTDSAWALANPGTQIIVLTTTHMVDENGEVQLVTTATAIGTVSNLLLVGSRWQPPALPAGMTWVQARNGEVGTVVLRSDGAAFVDDSNAAGRPIVVPDLPAGLTYTRVAAGHKHFVLLRSDGTAFAVGFIAGHQALDIPDLPAGLRYIDVAAGVDHTVLLRSDGTVIAVGRPSFGETTIPDLPAGLTYTHIGAAGYVTALLRSDGTAVLVGDNRYGQTDVPGLPPGVTYSQVSNNSWHTVLLRSDGTVTAFGYGPHGQLEIPELPEGMTYVRVAAGSYYTLLLRSDGAVIAVGDHRLVIPALPDGVAYTQISAGPVGAALFIDRV